MNQQPEETLPNPNEVVSKARKREIRDQLRSRTPEMAKADTEDEAEERRTVTRRTAVGFLGAALAGLLGRSIIGAGQTQAERQQAAAVSATANVLRPDPPRENIPIPTLMPTQNPVPTPERLPKNTPITFTKRSYSVAPIDTVPEPKLDPKTAATNTAIALEKKP